MPIQWLRGGSEFFPAMISAIESAWRTVDVEVYTFVNDHIGRQVLHALVAAAARGVRVRVLADAFGSVTLPANFFQPLLAVGGRVRFFNPLRFGRFSVRDHRKLLLCDGETAFIGGANFADNYDGDGVQRGWFDFMVRIQDAALATDLVKAFEKLYVQAIGRLRRPRLRAFQRIRRGLMSVTRILPVTPGRGAGVFQRALQHDLERARSVDIIVPYFLPNRRLRKLLCRIVRSGGRVRLILPSRCDVPPARAAGLIYYSRLLRGGVEIYEYQPQILHAKLYIVDDKVYTGSSNLDIRSFKLNYELMVRLSGAEAVAGAREVFAAALEHSLKIEPHAFRQSQGLWHRWKNRWSHFLLAQIDPLVALRQIHSRRSWVRPRHAPATRAAISRTTTLASG